MAQAHEKAGARRLHVVDLDAARGTGSHRELVRRIVTESGLAVQVAGGIRTQEDLLGWLEIGTRWVVMGTSAVRDPDFLARCAAEHPGRVLAALDLRDGKPAVTGWTQAGEVDLEPLVARWEAASLGGIIVTSIDRDGTLAGPDLGTLDRVAGLTTQPLIYSGGIGSLDDIRAVATSQAVGVILGKALYEQRFTVWEAIEAVG